MKNLKRLAALTGAAAIVASCQSVSLPGADASAGADNPSLSLAEEATQAANADAAAGGQCSIALAGGPPPKPAKGADFAKNAVGKNVARNAGRNVIAGIGGRLGGGLGGAIAGGIARDQIRTEQDLKGTWMITDGSQDCGCQLDISSGTNMRMQSSSKGRLKPKGCSSLVAGAANWTLGHSFTGYDAPFQLLAPDRKTVVASMKRDGINYFSGTLADGTAVTMWRRMGDS